MAEREEIMLLGRSISIAALTLSAAFSIIQPAVIANGAEGDAGTSIDEPAVVARAACKFSKFKFVTDSTSQSTLSSVFTLLTDSDTVVSIKGDNPGCVVVNFSGQGLARSTQGKTMNVQAVLDNATIAEQGAVQFVAESGTLSDTHEMFFVFPSVEPGEHTLQIFFRSGVNGQNVFMNKWSMTVQF
jgi:hypothetical protein